MPQVLQERSIVPKFKALDSQASFSLTSDYVRTNIDFIWCYMRLNKMERKDKRRLYTNELLGLDVINFFSANANL